MSSKKDEFTVTWLIENFSMCPQKKGERIVSPTFVVAALDKTRWQLELFPKGKDSDHDFTSFYLSRTSKEEEPDEIAICFSVNWAYGKIKQNGFDDSPNTFKKHQSFGYRNFFPSDYLPIKNELILKIQCYMWRVTDGKESPAESKEVPATPLGTAVSLEEMSSVVSDLGSEISSVNSDHYRAQCTFSTRIPVERRLITWTIKDFETQMQSKRKISISVLSAFREKSALLLSCYVSRDRKSDGSVRIDIQRKEGDFRRTRVKCEVNVFDRSGVDIEATEDEFLFGEDYEVWSFPPVVKLSTLACLEQDELSLRCEFHISYDGGYDGPNVQRLCQMEEDTLGHDMNELLHDRNFADVTFISEDLELAAHKSILCARSPVFRAMFSGDTQENRTGVVRITDIDMETVKNMRNFLYKGFVLELQPENAFKLYSAADKYQISKLKKQCASSMKYNLSTSTVCDVLILADMHQDSDLRKYVEDFLCDHAKDIFQSTEWKDLVKKNIQLAWETIQRVLVKIINS